jgi:hypothetical protein
MMELVPTVVPIDTPMCRVIENDDMTCCSDAATIKTCHMATSIIA